MALIVVGISLMALLATDVMAQSGVRSNYSLNPANDVARSILNRPTVSPYLNLVGPDGTPGVARYQTLVRPQLEARQYQLRNSARFQSVQNQLQQVSTAIGQASTQQQRQNYPFTTGHPSVYLNGSHYYPGLNAR